MPIRHIICSILAKKVHPMACGAYFREKTLTGMFIYGHEDLSVNADQVLTSAYLYIVIYRF